MRRRTHPLLWALPVLGLAVGAGAAVLFAGDSDGSGGTAGSGGPAASTPGAAAGDAPTIEAAAWSPTDLATLAPPVDLPPRPDPTAIDLSSVVGYPTPPAAVVPAGAALSLAIGADGTPPVVHPQTLEPFTAPAPVVLPPLAAVLSPPIIAPASPVATVPSGEAAPSTTHTAVDIAQQFIDPCAAEPAGPAACSGRMAVVAADEGGGNSTLAAGQLTPLVLSAPFAATAGLAEMCAEVERGTVADPQLAAAVRPTVVVLMNRPASVALTGTWADGTAIDKSTMLTLSAHEVAWQEQWDTTGEQGRLVACLTFPLDIARSHAAGGRAQLTVDVIGISADGQDTAGGAVTLEVPLDGEDVPFVEAYSVRDLGEQLLADGRRAPTLSVHYAIVDDDRVPAGSTLDASSLTVLDVHAAVENADCTGWAANALGQDRTLSSTYQVRQEQRTINGRQRSVTVVDGVVHLDPNVRSGWEGFLCTQLVATDRTGARATLALRGAAVRAPRTAVYDIGVRVAAPLPDGWQLDVAWVEPDGTVWCGPAALAEVPVPPQVAAGDTTPTTAAPAAPPADVVLSAGCTTLARLHPRAVVLTLEAIGPLGEQGPEWTVNVPISTAFCNPDDPDGATTDGCSTGWLQTWAIPLTPDGALASVTVTVVRDAGPGQVLTNPSHAWRIDPPQAFLT